MPSDEKGDKPPPELKPYCYRLTTDRESHSQQPVCVAEGLLPVPVPLPVPAIVPVPLPLASSLLNGSLTAFVPNVALRVVMSI